MNKGEHFGTFCDASTKGTELSQTVANLADPIQFNSCRVSSIFERMALRSPNGNCKTRAGLYTCARLANRKSNYAYFIEGSITFSH